MSTFNYLVAGSAVIAAPAFGIAMGWALKPVRRKRAAPEFVEVPVLTMDDLAGISDPLLPAGPVAPIGYPPPVMVDGRCFHRLRPKWWKPEGSVADAPAIAAAPPYRPEAGL